jgi:acyl-CoA synthetase (AMP-forming)/AMP-acid ligase II
VGIIGAATLRRGADDLGDRRPRAAVRVLLAVPPARFTDAIPRTPSGNVLRRALREQEPAMVG